MQKIEAEALDTEGSPRVRVRILISIFFEAETRTRMKREWKWLDMRRLRGGGEEYG